MLIKLFIYQKLKSVNNKMSSTKRDLKKFGLISAVLFSIIVVISTYLVLNCASFGNCGFISNQVFNAIFLTIGSIGIIYGLIIIRSFDSKIDNDIIQDIKELNDFNENNGAEKDKIYCL